MRPEQEIHIFLLEVEQDNRVKFLARVFENNLFLYVLVVIAGLGKHPVVILGRQNKVCRCLHIHKWGAVHTIIHYFSLPFHQPDHKVHVVFFDDLAKYALTATELTQLKQILLSTEIF